MGKLESEFQFTGRLGNLTAYRMQGVDKIVVRRRGGATKERIQNDRSFARTRENNHEFKGRAQGVKRFRLSLGALPHVADFNFYGNLNKVLSYVQKGDTVSSRGARSVLLSKYGKLLEGFSLNKYTTFDRLISTPIGYILSREARSAKLTIPQLIPELNFSPPQKHPLFKLEAVLSIIPDLFSSDRTYKPSDELYEKVKHEKAWISPWMQVSNGAPATTVEIQLPDTPPDDSWALILSIGVHFGAYDGDRIRATKHAGAAKILAVEGTSS